MSEIGETFAALRQIKRNKKLSNLIYSTDLLDKKGIKYESKNDGIHLIVECGSWFVDFWPSTGKYRCRGSKKHGRGIRELLKYIDKRNAQASGRVKINEQ